MNEKSVDDMLAQWTVLPTERLAETPSGLGRPQPEVDGTWNPDVSIVADIAPALRRVLQPLLDAIHRRDARWFPTRTAFLVEDYFVQCSGILRGARRFVFLSGCRHFDTMGEPPDWRCRPFFGLDGGPSLFRAEYDVDAQRVVALTFNGPYSAVNPPEGWTWPSTSMTDEQTMPLPDRPD